MSEKTYDTFLPDFCSFRMLLATFILAELLAFVLTLAADYSEFGFLSAFGLRSLLVLWVVLMSTAALCLSRRWLGRFNNFNAGLIAFTLIQLIVILGVRFGVRPRCNVNSQVCCRRVSSK